jgi:ADP-ribose pyrophosphatase
MLKKWKKISEELLIKNNWWEYKKDTFNIPEVKTGEYHYVSTKGSSMVIPFVTEDKVICVKQYRYLNDDFSIEFPCGGVLENDDYFITAKKELEEETGYTSNNIEPIGEFNPYNGVTNEICKVFVARDLKKCDSKPDITEEFEILILTFDEIKDMVRKKFLWDGMTLASISIYEIFNAGKC